jgi:hypothetical protein
VTEIYHTHAARCCLTPVCSGTKLPSTHITAHLMLGRAYTALGRTVEGASAFEAAAEQANRHGFNLYEVFALRCENCYTSHRQCAIACFTYAKVCVCVCAVT